MDSGYKYVCNLCKSVNNKDYCFREDDKPCKSVRCFTMTMTPVDVETASYPEPVMARLKLDLLTFGNAFLIIDEVERVVHGEKKKFKRYTIYPAERATIDMLRDWEKVTGRKKFTTEQI